MVRNPALVRLFFAAEMTPGERRALIETGRARSAAKLAALEEALVMAEQLSPGAAATARYGLAVERAVQAWFDEAPWGLEV
ncbi:MAG: hypothetical protein ACT452_06055 [Microthrixaceae bacterium]